MLHPAYRPTVTVTVAVTVSVSRTTSFCVTVTVTVVDAPPPTASTGDGAAIGMISRVAGGMNTGFGLGLTMPAGSADGAPAAGAAAGGARLGTIDGNTTVGKGCNEGGKLVAGKGGGMVSVKMERSPPRGTSLGGGLFGSGKKKGLLTVEMEMGSGEKSDTLLVVVVVVGGAAGAVTTIVSRTVCVTTFGGAEGGGNVAPSAAAGIVMELTAADDVTVVGSAALDVDDATTSCSPRTAVASALFQQLTSTPSVVFMGSARHVVPAPQRVISKAPAALQKPTFPLTHATWPGLQADCSVRPAKMELNAFAASRLAANVCGDTVTVAGGSVVMAVGILATGLPVGVTLTTTVEVENEMLEVVSCDASAAGGGLPVLLLAGDDVADASGVDVDSPTTGGTTTNPDDTEREDCATDVDAAAAEDVTTC